MSLIKFTHLRTWMKDKNKAFLIFELLYFMFDWVIVFVFGGQVGLGSTKRVCFWEEDRVSEGDFALHL